MSEFFRGNPADREPKKMIRLSRADAEKRVSAGEHFDSVDVSGLDLSGLTLSGKSFRGARAENVHLYQKASEGKAMVTTDISHSDWTNAVLVSESSDTIFIRVNAEGARFGFSEPLAACRKRNHAHFEKTGLMPSDDRNALIGFNGSGGDFKKTSWSHIDFGGAECGARFQYADFNDAVFSGCDLSGIDLSSCELEGVTIKDPFELHGLKIAAKHMDSIARGLSFSEREKENDLEERAYMYENDPQAFLESYGIEIDA